MIPPGPIVRLIALGFSLVVVMAGVARAETGCETARRELIDMKSQQQTARQARALEDLKRLSERFDHDLSQALASIHEAFVAEIAAIQAQRPKDGHHNDNFARNRALDAEIAAAQARTREERSAITNSLRADYHRDRAAILAAYRADSFDIRDHFSARMRELRSAGDCEEHSPVLRRIFEKASEFIKKREEEAVTGCCGIRG